MNKVTFLPEFQETYNKCKGMNLTKAFQQHINQDFDAFERKGDTERDFWSLGEEIPEGGHCVAIVPATNKTIYVFTRN